LDSQSAPEDRIVNQVKKEMPTVSIVTNVYNAQSTIETYLDSLARQTFKGFELVVVDDGSTDRTIEIVEGYRQRLNLRVLRLPHIGLRAARAKGVDAATTEIVIILDADEVVQPDCIDRFMQPFEDPSVGAVGGRLIPLGEGWIIQGSALLRDLKHAMRRDKKGEAWVIVGGCMAVRKAAVEAVRGFTSEKQVAEDYDISRKLREGGWRLVSLDDLEVFHRDPMTLFEVFQRQFKVGRRFFPTLRTGMTSLPILKLVAPIFYTLSLVGAIMLTMADVWVGAFILALMFIAVILLFRKINSTLAQKTFAWVVLTVDSLGYTLGAVLSLVQGAFGTIIGRLFSKNYLTA
jgi:cellulose synthase/poly-beta-1,6-N-acetylglucosamine synthase-like glycosyltransferase